MVRWSAAVIVAIGLVAAPTAGSASVADKKVEACTALTAADIESVLAVTGVGPDTQGIPSDATNCSYAWQGASFGSAHVGLGTYDKSVKKDLPKNSKQPGAEKIPGVKKGYVNAEGGSSGAIIEAVKGKKFVTIQVFAEGVTKDQLITLMKLVLKRL